MDNTFLSTFMRQNTVSKMLNVITDECCLLAMDMDVTLLGKTQEAVFEVCQNRADLETALDFFPEGKEKKNFVRTWLAGIDRQGAKFARLIQSDSRIQDNNWWKILLELYGE